MTTPRWNWLVTADGRRQVGVPYTITDHETGTVLLSGRTTRLGRYRLPRDLRRAYDVTLAMPERTVRLYYPAETVSGS